MYNYNYVLYIVTYHIDNIQIMLADTDLHVIQSTGFHDGLKNKINYKQCNISIPNFLSLPHSFCLWII